MDSSREVSDGSSSLITRKLSRTYTALSAEIVDPEVVPAALADIAPILRVANEIEEDSPRVAYLCRFYAFDKAHQIDQSSAGRGVRQFKTALLHKLEQDDEKTLKERKAKSDPREMQEYYEKYYRIYTDSLGKKDRPTLAKLYQKTSVLFDVLKAVNQDLNQDLEPHIAEQQEELKEKESKYEVFNILPLDDSSFPLMMLPEIRAAIGAIRNIRGLPGLSESEMTKEKGVNYDLFDWLQSTFSFQKANVANQRENFILLLANVYARKQQDQQEMLNGLALDAIMKKLFKNYLSWCKFLDRKDHLRLPTIQQEIQQRKVLYIGLYLLIWGEAANLRFMPECLCYIFHNMAGELYGMLAGNVSSVTGENVKPGYVGGGECDFLDKVVKPIYAVIEREFRCETKKSSHSVWRNYDDLNEYFWSVHCFTLGWPMRQDRDFFQTDKRKYTQIQTSADRRPYWMGKINFVEARSFLHLFRSFDGMWSFFILSLQAMIIIAWNGSGSIGNIFNGSVFEKVLSIFITSAILRFVQAIVDIALSLPAWASMHYLAITRYILKLIVALAWVIALPICYAHSWGVSTGLVSTFKNWFGESRSPSVYVTAVLVYLAPDAASALLFLLPMLRRHVEQSEWRIVKLMLWWHKPAMYVGRGMHETPYVLFRYTLFWMLLLLCKLLFSFYLEIKPLVEPTKKIMSTSISPQQYKWHEMFPTARNNLGVVISLWAPIILVYFMDTQIWYAIWSTIFGGINGAFSRLGEIRTPEMLRSRFRALPSAVNANLFSPRLDKRTNGRRKRFTLRKSYKALEVLDNMQNQEEKISEQQLLVAKFSQIWNMIIQTMWEEDYIKSSEKELLMIPYSPIFKRKYVQWPHFLLANKVASVVEMLKDLSDNESDDKVFWKIERDPYMKFAIVEFYDLFLEILKDLTIRDLERNMIRQLKDSVEETIKEKKFFKTFKISGLPLLFEKIVEVVNILDKADASQAEYLTLLLQDLHEVYTQDVKPDSEIDTDESFTLRPNEGRNDTDESFTLKPNERRDHHILFGRGSITYPPVEELRKKIRRLFLLLTTDESSVDVPSNLEARRRLTFFANSLFMDMPLPPQTRNMVSFSVLTPYNGEEIVFMLKALEEDNDDGISALTYLQNIYPDEWDNFTKRVKSILKDKVNEEKVHEEKANEENVNEEKCKWASYRAQTLARTVRGMMYYRRAIELQAFFDTAEPAEIITGYEEFTKCKTHKYASLIQAIASMKFTYIVSCQEDEFHKRVGESHGKDIESLLQEYPDLRVAYVEEKELPIESDRDDRKEYFSVLIKVPPKVEEEEEDKKEGASRAPKAPRPVQEIYRIKLPGQPVLGERKAENQNCAIIFTRGEALQAIDMNQDNYFEEALKMRNFLQEFDENHGVRQPSVLGMREHIFSGSVSSLAGFMSSQETSFVTIGQRVLSNPLKVRFHYGHPDVFDRLFHMTRGGLSKASPVINLSEHIFAGFNTILRRGNITHHEYIQVGKGRDMGLNQISLFEGRIATGNGEQSLSRDMYRLGHRVDFFRMLSVYFTTIGPYVNTLIVIIAVYVFLYGRIYLALSGLETSLVRYAGLQDNVSLQVAMTSASFVEIGFLIALPLVMEIGLEHGFRKALSEFIVMQLQLASVFFTFLMGTRAHYFGRTLLHGGIKFRPPESSASKHTFVVVHAKFTENYRLYSRSHFTKGLELLMLLIIYDVYGAPVNKTAPYILITFLLWFMVGTWLFAPFLFNPSGFEWQKIVDDWEDWHKWINNRGGVGVPADRSWETWWDNEIEHLGHSGLRGRVIEILLASRFLLYQYGLVYHLNIAHHNKSIVVYFLSWVVLGGVLGVLKLVSLGRQQFSSQNQLLFRLLKGVLFLTVVAILIVLFVVVNLTIGDVFVLALAFLPTGWAFIQIAQTFRVLLKNVNLWDSVKALARGYDSLMGYILIAPVATLAWFPFISDFQTRILFNQAFSRGLQISRILAGKKDKKTN